MKSRILISAVLALGLLQGCAYKVLYDVATDKADPFPVTTVATPYEPATQARIRVLSGYITKNSLCYGDNPESMGKRALQLLKMSTFLSTGVFGESISVGMPRGPKRNDLIFTEEVLTAGQPIAIRAWLDYSRYDPGTKTETKIKCIPPAVSFVPENGRDYETALHRDASTCWIAVHTLDSAGLRVTAASVPVTVAPACPASP